MNKTKIIFSLIIMVIAICILGSQGVKAAQDRTLNIQDVRPFSDDNGDGEIGNDKYTFSRRVSETSAVNETIWKIYDVDKSDVYDNIYCLRGGLGFGSSTTIKDSLLYNFVADMKENADIVIQTYKERTGVNITDENYNAILWILDNMYLPNDDGTYLATEYKTELLEAADIAGSELTDDDIEVIQQMALWYFTNYDENGQYGSFSLANTVVISNILKINSNNFNSISETRAEDAVTLYQYFINGASENAIEYGTENIRQIENTKIVIENKTTPQINETNQYILVGPYNLEKTGNAKFEINGEKVQIKLSNGTENEIPFGTTGVGLQYAISDANGNIITSRDTVDSVSSMIDKGEFYIRLEKNNLNSWLAGNTLEAIEVKFNVDWHYYNTTSEFWVEKVYNNLNPAQPVTIVTREKTNGIENVNITTEQLSGEFNINISKIDDLRNIILSEAKFELELQEESNARPMEYTTVNGHILTSDINILDKDKTYIYKVTETQAPIGYVGLEKPFYIRIVTGLNDENNRYIVKSVRVVEYDSRTNEWVDSNNENITISLTNSEGKITINLEVMNKEIEPFDLSLRKFITEINGKKMQVSREPIIDLSKLDTIDSSTNKKITTATYNHPKNVISVKQGDIIKYTIRVYNEGERDGYVNEITDYLPEGLGLLVQEPTNNIWKIPTDGAVKPLVGNNGIYENKEEIVNNYLLNYKFEDALGEELELDKVYVLEGNTKITTDFLKRDESVLSANLIKAYNPDAKEEDIEEGNLWQKSKTGENGLYYRDVEVVCIVLADNTYKDEIRNIAEITKAVDIEGTEIINEGDDRDSVPNNVDLNEYIPPLDNSSYQEDDDDYEAVRLQYFDLALRKFITGVNDEIVTTRVPQAVYVASTNQINYLHTKEPVRVKTNDIVYYTLRIYNEGSIEGYADEITDDIPEGLEFLPENEINIKYGWKMYYKEGDISVETNDVSKATTIKTTYLKYNEDGENLLKAFNPKTMDSPDYREVKIAFKVTEPTTSDRIIINSAQISDDSDEYGREVKDEDSIPDKWNEGEDDQDKEYIYVEYFDLALLKWVSKSIVTLNGKTTTTETGYNGLEDPEPIVKVEVKKLNQIVVKFEYGIKITNEGEIEGYAKEIKDYIPEGLEFRAEDNAEYGWIDNGDGTVSTRALETVLLKPGESSTIYITFRWKNNPNNLGIKTNIAEISEDYNENNVPDIDSDPNNYDHNKGIQEDDEDLALVMLTVATGGESITAYIILAGVVLTILLGGILLIKKYVL